MKLGVVLLAAGRSERFGANKLLADFAGRPMVCWAMDMMGKTGACRKAVVVSGSEIAKLARSYGYDVIYNDSPERGQAYSIVLAAQAMADMDALLVMAADQPILSMQSLLRLIDGFCASSKGLACLRDDSHRGNPAIFSRVYYDQLLALHGDRGARSILRAHEDDLCVIPCVYPDELSDADTPQTLESLRQAYENRA